MRSKEEAHDYRYFPDPDLLPLEFDQAYVDELAAHLPELPDAKRARFIAEYGLSAYDASVLVAERGECRLFRGRRRRGSGRQGRRELGDQRAVRPPQQGGQGRSRPHRSRRAARRHRRSHRRRRDLGQDRQGSVRDRLERRRRSARARRGARPEAGDRHGRDRGGGRRDHRGQSGQGRAGQGQADLDRLVRRAGDEIDGRQGQSAGGERALAAQARDLS